MIVVGQWMTKITTAFSDCLVQLLCLNRLVNKLKYINDNTVIDMRRSFNHNRVK